jgi:hypothetical protein
VHPRAGVWSGTVAGPAGGGAVTGVPGSGAVPSSAW